jgi:phosphonate transport system substrate-binding protein
MATRGTIKAAEFREVYRSPVFPTSSFAHAHDLKPELAARLRQCFYDFRFPAEMQKEFNGDDRFFPIGYQKDWAVVREVAEKSGTPYNKAAYEQESKREAEAAARRAQQQQQQQQPAPAK